MSDLASRVTEEQVAAAQLRIVLDEKLGRDTPDVVRQIARVKKPKPSLGEPGVKFGDPTVADRESPAGDPGRRVRDPGEIHLALRAALAELQRQPKPISDNDTRECLRRLHSLSIELQRDHPHASDLLAEVKAAMREILARAREEAQPADVELGTSFGMGTSPEYGGRSGERDVQEIDINDDFDDELNSR